MVGSGDEEEESRGGGAELAVGVQCKQNERAHSFIILRLGQQTRRQGHAARGVDAVAATCGALQIFEMKLKSNKGSAERDTHTQTH